MKTLKAILKVVVPLVIGFFFIYLSYVNTTEEDRKRIVVYIQSADLRFLLLSVLFAILSHLSRAYRWLFMLKPLGYQPQFYNSVFAVMVAYLANLGVPRSGEVLRATTLSSYENIPFEKGFGTIITERLIDLLMLAVCIAIALALQYDLIYSFLAQKEFNVLLLLGGLLVFIITILWFRFLFQTNQSLLIQKFKKILYGLVEGILSFKKMPNKGFFIAHTLFIWLMYLAMFYVVKWCLPGTAGLTLAALMPAFVVGGLTISATNGGIGIYPYAVGMILGGYNISSDVGLAFGWIMWTAQTAMILIFGGLSFFLLPLFNRKKANA